MLAIESIRTSVDHKYVGLSPDTRSIKPVHIANGLFRTLTGKTYDTEMLNRFVVSQKHDGEIPKGHDLPTIYQWLAENGRIDSREVKEDNLKRFRVLLKKVVNADDGVYLHKDLMESYSSGYIGFVTRDRIAQSAGEFFGTWLMKRNSPLANCIRDSLQQPDDPISILGFPLLDDEPRDFVPKIDFEEVEFFRASLPDQARDLWNGLEEAAATLSKHLQLHPNKLLRLRLAVLFASFVVIRHLTTLEACYVPSREKAIPPFLLDFSEKESEPVARASLMSYTHACQSISRFYAWAFGEHLRSQYGTLEAIEAEGVPTYKRAQPKEEWQELWQIALNEARGSDQPFLACGQTLYHILASEAEGDPIRYLRQLGHRSGFMWPPENFQPAKRFVLQQDMLEVLIRESVEPGHTIDMLELQRRLWRRFGVVIGGRPKDQQLLLEAGIYQADGSALRLNRERFAARLSSLDFARLLADGVMQVELEGDHATRT